MVGLHPPTPPPPPPGLRACTGLMGSEAATVRPLTPPGVPVDWPASRVRRAGGKSRPGMSGAAGRAGKRPVCSNASAAAGPPSLQGPAAPLSCASGLGGLLQLACPACIQRARGKRRRGRKAVAAGPVSPLQLSLLHHTTSLAWHQQHPLREVPQRAQVSVSSAGAPDTPLTCSPGLQAARWPAEQGGPSWQAGCAGCEVSWLEAQARDSKVGVQRTAQP